MLRAAGGGGGLAASPAALWLAAGWVGFALLPWYDVRAGFFAFTWLFDGWPAAPTSAPALMQALLHERPWLLLLALPLAAPMAVLGRPRPDPLRSRVLIAAGAGGLAWMLIQGFGIGLREVQFGWLAWLLGTAELRQGGMGWGALITAFAFLFLLTEGLAGRGAGRGDGFVVGAIGLVVATVATFIFFPVFAMLAKALQAPDGAFAPSLFVDRLVDARIWGLGCLGGGVGCGTAWNTLLLAVLTGVSTALLGLAFALIVTRTDFPWKKPLRLLTVLPIITPPFVIGLAIILLFGRSGVATQFVAGLMGIPPGRWIYGLPGIWLAQTLAFTPIAFLVMIGVVEGVSPSMEEAAQTLRANSWRTFTTVTLPLMRPGLANAFLLGFIESMADFGNPIVLGGGYNVLATDIYFAIVGAQYDPGRAAILAIVLLAFTLGAFWAQNQWLGRKAYTTVSGKGDAGVPVQLPKGLKIAVYATALPWAGLTAVIYAMIMFGGFVEVWGRNHSLTLRHYTAAFAITQGEHGLVWSGMAWNSFWTTIQVAAIAAVPTAAIGLLTAWLLVRQRFMGQRAFEFGTMLSFAIPGTVIGVSYIIAFNVPPIELTGTAAILVIAFIFRNMPVGVRAGIATLSQIDKSLDEASLTLRASTLTTVRKVLMPLLRPALIAALVYSFVTAMTAVSAVVFLVSARHHMATTYILGRVENGDYGIAIAYCSVLILVMAASIVLVQLLIGERRLGRRSAVGSAVPAVARG
jgi:iron(III) transport system permease protein